jgi:beta-1,4-N-acetylglucosaminyltransferase
VGENRTKSKTVLVVCSSGGHLDQALLAIGAFEGWNKVFATFDKEDSRSRLADSNFYKLHFPTNRNLMNSVRNLLLAIKVIRLEKPDLIFSTGAAAAVPFFFIARISGIKTMYLECFDRIFLPTLTAKLVKNLTSYFICQSEDQMLGWPNRIVIGPSR